MTLGELIAAARLEAFDFTAPYLVSDAEFTAFFNEAQLEAVRRGWPLIDSTTTDICELTFAASESVLTLDPRILVIRQAIVRGQIIPLLRMKMDRLNLTWPGWKDHTASHPTMWVDDYQTGSIKLYPIPLEAGVVDLTVSREPLFEMEGTADEPELPVRHHRSLMYWALHRFYSKHDVETQDVQQAMKYEAMFAREFGERRSARSEAWEQQQTGILQDTLA